MGDFQRKLKEGEILRYKSSFLGKKWKECWAVLFSDSEFIWYDKKGDSKPAGSVFLKDVVPYTCVGPMCDRMPVRRPELPQRYSLYHLVAIGMDSQASKVHWFLFSSDSDLEAWFTEIMKTLPKPNPPPANASQQLPSSGPNAPPPTYNPPPVYPSSPSQITNTLPNQPIYNPPTIPSQPSAYPSTVPNYGGIGGGGGGGTTVIIDRNGGGYGQRYGGGGGGSSGPGLGSGMLMGSLLGFGLGSMWGGGLHSGFGWGGHCYPSHYGMGGGFGGAYTQDNDTYITNNYFSSDPENRGAISEHNAGSSTIETADSTNNPDTVQDYYDGYDVSGGGGGDYDNSGDYDVGGGVDDYGGYDIGGGDDFGGGDFDGGEW